MAATNGDHSSDRMTLREIEIAIRSAMPLPVQSVVFVDEGGRLGVARNLDTRSVSGPKPSRVNGDGAFPEDEDGETSVQDAEDEDDDGKPLSDLLTSVI